MDAADKSQHSLQLELPPSCIEFCPRYPEFFLVGTYNLEKPQNQGDEVPEEESDAQQAGSKTVQNRSGSIVIFKMQLDEAHFPRPTLTETIAQPSAILDLHFCPQIDRNDVCAVVSSTATIALFRLEPDRSSQTLQDQGVWRVAAVGEDVIFTSFAWHPSIPHIMAVTETTGKVWIVTLLHGSDALIANGDVVVTHTLEAWCCAFSQSTASLQQDCILLSGGDDSALRCASFQFDSSENNKRDSILKPQSSTVSDARSHQAGVTAILPLSLEKADGSIITITGSYDDHIRVFSIIPLALTGGIGQIQLLGEMDLGGGVWRLKLIKQVHRDDGGWSVVLLVSCMHAGAKVVRIGRKLDADCNIEVLASQTRHKSMNYGCDFRFAEMSGLFTCVSTSFYDRQLCVWQIGLEDCKEEK